MTRFRIIGAGMAGLLAGCILRDEAAEIVEKQPQIPNNHAALLRFRSSIVGDALNLPFEKVKIMKATIGSLGNPIADAISYSMKTNGTASLRSSIGAGGKIEERYIAPKNFIQRMVDKVSCPIFLDQEMDLSQHYKYPIISTMPMPSLMVALGYKKGEEISFPAINGFVVKARLKDCNVCATIYYPAGHIPYYRASITNGELIIEFSDLAGSVKETIETVSKSPKSLSLLIEEVLAGFGLGLSSLETLKPEVKEQKYAKILPIDEDERRRFILWASEEHNIYSLGRFATWRPGLLLDDMVNDLRVIQKIATTTKYDHVK